VIIAAATKAVVASWVVLVPPVAVSAVETPVNVAVAIVAVPVMVRLVNEGAKS
jgi:hypothetical protein